VTSSTREMLRHAAVAAVAALCLLAAEALKAEQPEPVRVEVTWVESEAEMDAKRREFGRVAMDSVIRTKLTGFSVLGKRDGALVCLIFAPKPRTEDDKATLVLGHELAHCLLGAYHH
jgi:hypothetical protein